MTNADTSEFGKGLCYNLGLFIGHEHKLTDTLKTYRTMHEQHADLFNESDAISLWFNGSADHFYEFQPEYAPLHLRDRCTLLQTKCLHWRLPLRDADAATLADANWALQEAKDLLRLIDSYHGIPTIKGTYE